MPVFNVSKGKAAAYHDNVYSSSPANCALVVVMLKAGESNAVLEDYSNLLDLLAAAGNSEADFTGYSRKILTSADISPAIADNTNNWQSVDIPDPVWDPAGGAVNNALSHFLLCYDPDTTTGDDSSIVPMIFEPVTRTTNGTDPYQVKIDAAGYFRAQ